MLKVLCSKLQKRQKSGIRIKFFILGKPAMFYLGRAILFLTHTCPRQFACLPPCQQLLWSHPETPERAALFLAAVSQTPNFIFRSELAFEALKTFAASVAWEEKQPKQSAPPQQPRGMLLCTLGASGTLWCGAVCEICSPGLSPSLLSERHIQREGGSISLTLRSFSISLFTWWLRIIKFQREWEKWHIHPKSTKFSLCHILWKFFVRSQMLRMGGDCESLPKCAPLLCPQAASLGRRCDPSHPGSWFYY